MSTVAETVNTINRFFNFHQKSCRTNKAIECCLFFSMAEAYPWHSLRRSWWFVFLFVYDAPKRPAGIHKHLMTSNYLKFNNSMSQIINYYQIFFSQVMLQQRISSQRFPLLICQCCRFPSLPDSHLPCVYCICEEERDIQIFGKNNENSFVDGTFN